MENDKSIVHAKDENGWTPLHEASRGGHTDVVRFLHKHGADVNARTSEGAGGKNSNLSDQSLETNVSHSDCSVL